MSLNSHGMLLMHASTGFPFCLGETRMLDPDDREGRACGVGWTIFWPAPAPGGGARSRRCGVGCWGARCGCGCWTAGREGPASVAASAARKSSSTSNSSSMVALFLAVVVMRARGGTLRAAVDKVVFSLDSRQDPKSGVAGWRRIRARPISASLYHRDADCGKQKNSNNCIVIS